MELVLLLCQLFPSFCLLFVFFVCVCVASFHCAQQREEEEAAPEIGASSPFLQQQQRHLVPVEIFKKKAD